MSESLAYARLPCQKPNHQKAALQYTCSQPKCLKNGNFLGCIHCSQDEHRQHLGSVVAIKVLLGGVVQERNDTDTRLHDLQKRRDQLHEELSQVEKEIAKLHSYHHHHKEQAKLTQVLMNNLKICTTEQAFRQNLFELIEASSVQPDERLLNDEMSQLRKFANNFEQNRTKLTIAEKKPEKVVEDKLHEKDQQVLRPIFTFKEADSHKLISPYSVKSVRTGFATVLAHPSLNTFPQSIELSFIIKRVRPDWLGVGLTRNKNNFSLTEKGFYLWVSNGWMFTDGQQQQTNQRYCQNDKITVRYDKAKNLIVMYKNGKSYEPWLTEVTEDVWNELHPCVVFYNKGDVVDILQ